MTIFGSLQKDGTILILNKREVDLGKVPSTDPLAFTFGIEKGSLERLKKYTDRSSNFKKIHGSTWRELAPEYLRGYKLGFTGILLPEGTPKKISAGYLENHWGSKHNLLLK